LGLAERDPTFAKEVLMNRKRKHRFTKTGHARAKPHRRVRRTSKKRGARARRNAIELPRARHGTLERTRALLLAALRVWELKNGFRLLTLPIGYFPIPLPV
jgi:hypothetical protein